MAQKKKTISRTKKPTSGKKTWVITTSADRPIAEIAKDLSAAGFAIDQTLDQMGVITGTCDEKGVKKARAVRGVADVSPDVQVDIGPPKSRDTW
jgi:hypothetical protein